jgi:hypothetical protein
MLKGTFMPPYTISYMGILITGKPVDLSTGYSVYLPSDEALGEGGQETILYQIS